MFHAGVVKGEVESSEGVVRLLQRSLDLLFARYIAFDSKRAPTSLFDESHSFVKALLRDVGRGDAGTRSGESQRSCTANAVSCPGHERDLSRKASIVGRHDLRSSHVSRTQLFRETVRV